MNIQYASLRLQAILQKEYIYIKRDFVTYLILVIVPFFEVILFGFLINTDPKFLPTYVVLGDHSNYTRTFISGLENTKYFRITNIVNDKKESEHALKSGEAQFVLNIPANFSRDLVRGNHPKMLLEADATDPVSIINAIRVASIMSQTILNHDLQGALDELIPKPAEGAFNLNIQSKYNPQVLAKYHVIPGLITVILGITLVLLMSINLTIEYEKGTLEMILVTPVQPIEVILGKLIPSLFIGFILLSAMLMLSHWVFHIPFLGSSVLLFFAALPYLLTCLLTGLAVSTISKSQFQAANFSNFYSLPSMLFSGFLFPFYGMPQWGQLIGNLLPMTHFMRILNGIMLKDSTFVDIWPDLWPIYIYLVFILYLCFKFYRRTLD